MTRLVLTISMAIFLALLPPLRPSPAEAATAAEIDAKVKIALEHLYAKNRVAKILAETAIACRTPAALEALYRKLSR